MMPIRTTTLNLPSLGIASNLDADSPASHPQIKQSTINPIIINDFFTQHHPLATEQAHPGLSARRVHGQAESSDR